MSLSADGNTAIVGGYADSYYAGAAWVWTRSAGVWTQQGSKLVGSGAVGPAFLGSSVSLSADGNTAIVGGYFDNSRAGAAWIWAMPAPAASAIAPSSGPTAGGTSVTITGTGFASGATVTIGGAAATGVTWVNATSITATTPAGSAGARNVVVTNPDTQSGTLSNGFTYVAAPTASAIAPSSGPTAGGTAVTITGTGFVSGAAVTIGGAPATSVTWVNATSITATTPAGTAGAKNVVVTNPDTQSATLTNGFTYVAAPTASAIAPSSGPTAGGTAVTITGTGFVSGATVTIGGAPATGVTWVNATSITAITPAGTAGAKNVVVTNPDTQTGTLNNGFTYIAAAPTVTSISPTSGPPAGGTSVTITGTGFVSGATVTIGGTPATGVTWVNATTITAITPAVTAGAKNVVVINPDTQAGTLTNGFTYSAIVITGVPTLSEWGLIILSGLLALFGLVQVRRTRRR